MAGGPSVEGLEAPTRKSPMTTALRRRCRPGQEPNQVGNSVAAGVAVGVDDSGRTAVAEGDEEGPRQYGRQREEVEVAESVRGKQERIRPSMKTGDTGV
ncbi:hypothetical protein CRENBAI_014088, partial [Crenichthys baileyi]